MCTECIKPSHFLQCHCEPVPIWHKAFIASSSYSILAAMPNGKTALGDICRHSLVYKIKSQCQQCIQSLNAAFTNISCHVFICPWTRRSKEAECEWVDIVQCYCCHMSTTILQWKIDDYCRGCGDLFGDCWRGRLQPCFCQPAPGQLGLQM